MSDKSFIVHLNRAQAAALVDCLNYGSDGIFAEEWQMCAEIIDDLEGQLGAVYPDAEIAVTSAEIFK